MTQQTPPTDGIPDFDPDVAFSEVERIFFLRLRDLAQLEAADLTPQAAHRLFLGAASEMIDAAADLASQDRPGVRVVELSLLATRTSQLAHEYLENER